MTSGVGVCLITVCVRGQRCRWTAPRVRGDGRFHGRRRQPAARRASSPPVVGGGGQRRCRRTATREGRSEGNPCRLTSQRLVHRCHLEHCKGGRTCPVTKISTWGRTGTWRQTCGLRSSRAFAIEVDGRSMDAPLATRGYSPSSALTTRARSIATTWAGVALAGQERTRPAAPSNLRSALCERNQVADRLIARTERTSGSRGSRRSRRGGRGGPRCCWTGRRVQPPTPSARARSAAA